MPQEGQRQIPRRPVMDVSSMALVQQRIAARLPFAPLSERLLMLQHHNYSVFALFSPQFKKCLLVLFTTNTQETMAKRVYCLQIRRITTIKEAIKCYFTTIEITFNTWEPPNLLDQPRDEPHQPCSRFVHGSSLPAPASAQQRSIGHQLGNRQRYHDLVESPLSVMGQKCV